MRIGVNWISPASLTIIQQLVREERINFCEIMVDNFVHLSAEKIKAALPGLPIGLHIVTSRFLEKPINELQSLARHLRRWIHDLQPVYVSEHLVQFTNERGQWLPLITELDYNRLHAHVTQRVQTWQSMLDVQLLFENHASLTVAGTNQAAFFQDLIHETQCGLLFDFSNAYIAERNKVCAFSAWDALIKQTNYFHVGGFRIDHASQLLLDTHDQPIADDILPIMQHYLLNKKDSMLVLERDASVTLADWQHDMTRVQQASLCSI